jgi:hypothetical protein
LYALSPPTQFQGTKPGRTQASGGGAGNVHSGPGSSAAVLRVITSAANLTPGEVGTALVGPDTPERHAPDAAPDPEHAHRLAVQPDVMHVLGERERWLARRDAL